MKHGDYKKFTLRQPWKVTAVILVGILLVVATIFYITNRTQYFSYNGNEYKTGESFTDKDGCNTCSFDADGNLQCTMMACDTDIEPPADEQIDLSFTYRNTSYRYTGTIQAPTPCHSVETETVIRESYPEDVALRFTVIDNAENCMQVIDPKPVNGAIAVSEAARIRVFVNNIEHTNLGVN